MTKGVVVHLDDNVKDILEPAKNLFDQLGLGLDYVICASNEAFNSYLKSAELPVKSLIFDLMSDVPASDPEFLDQIETAFLRYNVPVFIYSGYLESIGEKFDKNGTVYKFDKGKVAIKEIFDKIKFYQNSGFIDVFCQGGLLETEIARELNKSFTKQFTKNNEIEDVINSITIEPNPETGVHDKPERVKDIFRRIAIRSLSADLLAPITENKDKVHPIEHFYRRQNKLKFWTGDIWKNKADQKTHIIILTPRCDILNERVKHLLLCNIDPNESPISLSGNDQKVKDRLRKYLTDNLDTLKTKRYIPETVFFKDGGLVNLSTYHTIEKDSFEKIFEYIVTLSDEFTNELLGKLSYFFLRTGISTINEFEFKATIESLRITENVEE